MRLIQLALQNPGRILSFLEQRMRPGMRVSSATPSTSSKQRLISSYRVFLTSLSRIVPRR